MRKLFTFVMFLFFMLVSFAGTASAAALKVTLTSTTPTGGEVKAGDKNVEFAHFSVANTSKSDVKIGDFIVAQQEGQKGMIENLALYDSSGNKISEKMNTKDGNFYFGSTSGLFTVTKGATFKVIVKGDISASASAQNNSKVGISFSKSFGKDLSTNGLVTFDQSIKANLKMFATPECALATQPWIKVISPNGGEGQSYKPADKYTITWDSCNVKGKVDVALVYPSSFNLNFGITALTVDNTGSTTTTIPASKLFYSPKGLQDGTYYKISVTDHDTGKIVDMSDENFSIRSSSTPSCNASTSPWVKVISPNGGETYTLGKHIPVQWEKCNISGNSVSVKLGRTAAGFTFDLYDQYRNSVNFPLSVWPSLPPVTQAIGTGQYKIIVEGVKGGAQAKLISDQSDQTFTVKSPVSIAVSSKTTKAKSIYPGGKDIEFGRFIISNKMTDEQFKAILVGFKQVGTHTSKIENLRLYDTKGNKLNQSDWVQYKNTEFTIGNTSNTLLTVEKNRTFEVVVVGDLSSSAKAGETVGFKAGIGYGVYFISPYHTFIPKGTIEVGSPDTTNLMKVDTGVTSQNNTKKQ